MKRCAAARTHVGARAGAGGVGEDGGARAAAQLDGHVADRQGGGGGVGQRDPATGQVGGRDLHGGGRALVNGLNDHLAGLVEGHGHGVGGGDDLAGEGPCSRRNGRGAAGQQGAGRGGGGAGRDSSRKGREAGRGGIAFQPMSAPRHGWGLRCLPQALLSSRFGALTCVVAGDVGGDHGAQGHGGQGAGGHGAAGDHEAHVAGLQHLRLSAALGLGGGGVVGQLGACRVRRQGGRRHQPHLQQACVPPARGLACASGAGGRHCAGTTPVQPGTTGRYSTNRCIACMVLLWCFFQGQPVTRCHSPHSLLLNLKFAVYL